MEDHSIAGGAPATILVTGGAGFIGSNFVLSWLASGGATVVNLDRLTYAGNLANLAGLSGDPRHVFVRGDVNDRALLRTLLGDHRPRAVVHMAAESHVDRSIHGPDEFIRTNVNGTFSLLEEARAYWSGLPATERERFRFLYVSTDEVFGSLDDHGAPFRESTPYAPNSPYAATKAAGDLLVRAHHRTFGLPTLTTNCSNNFGPYQFPEKLIPLTIVNALSGQSVPVYGDGRNVRDWIHVEDHCAVLRAVLGRGIPGDTYCVGGRNERTNLEVVRTVCRILDDLVPDSPWRPHERLVTFVPDRPGHDRRYAVDIGKLEGELGWRPSDPFEEQLRRTATWYLSHRSWIEQVTSGEYRHWISLNYQDRSRT